MLAVQLFDGHVARYECSARTEQPIRLFNQRAALPALAAAVINIELPAEFLECPACTETVTAGPNRLRRKPDDEESWIGAVWDPLRAALDPERVIAVPPDPCPVDQARGRRIPIRQ